MRTGLGTLLVGAVARTDLIAPDRTSPRPASLRLA